MKNLKENNGITLVALIITIVVMLLLVATSVNILVNNDIIGHTEKTGETYKNAMTNEENYSPTVEDKKIDDYLVEEKTPTIPEGFEISKIPGESSLANGLVVYYTNGVKIQNWTLDTNNDGVYDVQEQYDQLVWIPVSEPNKMFMCQGKTENTQCNIELVNDVPTCTNPEHSTKATLMAGKLYALSMDNNFDKTLTNQAYSADSGLREPATLTDVDNGILYPTQSEYNDIVKSVIQNKGFWIGRYETTGMKNTDTADGTNIKVRANQSTGRVSVNWYNMYSQQKNYASNNNLSAISTMMLGSIYDQIMFMVDGQLDGANPPVEFNIMQQNSRRAGNLTTATGMNKVDKVYNIYDLEAGVYEWTTEANNNQNRVFRNRILSWKYFSKFPWS